MFETEPLRVPLMLCPDCSNDVSTSALACPHCGRPGAPLARSRQQLSARQQLSSRQTVMVCLVGALIVIALSAAVGGGLGFLMAMAAAALMRRR